MSYFVARSMFFLVTCSFGSECCRLRNSATALAGNSVSQTYPKSLARWTASPAKGDAGGKHTAHQYTWHRGKNPLGKKALPSTRVLLLKDLDLFLYKKGTVRNTNHVLPCRSCLCFSLGQCKCVFS